MENQQKNEHNLTLKDRKLLTMGGIEEVISFNDSKILLSTSRGRMIIEGKELNIRQLNLENFSIEIEGQIDDLQYSDREAKEGFLGKLFR